MKEKLTDLEKDVKKILKFGDCVSTDKDVYEHPGIDDLAGVRIGLYFSDDVVEVVDRIKKHF